MSKGFCVTYSLPMVSSIQLLRAVVTLSGLMTLKRMRRSKVVRALWCSPGSLECSGISELNHDCHSSLSDCMLSPRPVVVCCNKLSCDVL